MQSQFNARFIGEILFYDGVLPRTDGPDEVEWGRFYLSNPRRNQRPRSDSSTSPATGPKSEADIQVQRCSQETGAGAEDSSQPIVTAGVKSSEAAGEHLSSSRVPCPFCPGGKHVESGHPMDRFSFQNREYLVTPNAYPIVTGHRLILSAEHRVTLDAADFLLACHLPSLLNAWKEADVSPTGSDRAPNWCVYLNTPGAGQTVEHLHWQAVPAERLPRLRLGVGAVIAATAEWTLCRATDLGFYAWTLRAAGVLQMSRSLVWLDSFLRAHRVPYNLILQDGATDDQNGLEVLIVPRASVYAPEVNAFIAGFEILTGVLIPVEPPQIPLTVAARDRAFQEVTLSPSRSDALEAGLRQAIPQC